MEKSAPTLSIIAPVYLNEHHLPILVADIERVLQSMNEIRDYEVLLIDDGSPDQSWSVISALAFENPRIRGIKLSRNFGQHHAITAGLDLCRGEWALVMDADGQDSPECIPLLWKSTKDGFDVVSAKRLGRADGVIRGSMSRVFNGLFQFVSGLNYDRRIANFRLIHRKVVESLREMREASRRFPLHVHWLGFRSTSVEVPHLPRLSGKSAYTYFKLFGLALEVAVAYSNKPLKISVAFGGFFSLVSLVAMAGLLIRAWGYGIPVPGWASLIVSICFFSGLILANLGILGIYMGQILNEVRGRPIYAVESKVN